MQGKQVKLTELQSNFLPDTIVFGDQNVKVSDLTAFHCAFGNMTYILKSRLKDFQSIIKHRATAFITDYLPSTEEQELLKEASKVLIYNANARLQMAHLSSCFDYDKQLFDRHPYHRGGTISPFAYIESPVAIGEGTKIYANVTIYAGVTIGKNCIIHSGAVIGADGFGYEKNPDGTWFKIAHLGGVKIGDNVEVGANACIDRGTLDDTIIESGAKIDNLVHIAHNVRVKKNAMIIANAMVAGSVVIGEGAWIAPSSSIREGRIVGSGAVVGLGSVVVKDVAPGTTVMGVPAKEKL